MSDMGDQDATQLLVSSNKTEVTNDKCTSYYYNPIILKIDTHVFAPIIFHLLLLLYYTAVQTDNKYAEGQSTKLKVVHSLAQ